MAGPPRQGTGFVNFDQYLAANRGSAQALAERLSGDVRAQGKKAQGVIDPAMAEFERNLSTGGPNTPSSVADIYGFQQGQEAADKAAESSMRLADIYGRMGALGEAYGATPGYNYGMRGLDSALAGAVGQGQFEGMRKEYGDLFKQYGDALTASEKRADEWRKATPQPVQQAPGPLTNDQQRNPLGKKPKPSWGTQPTGWGRP